MSKLLIGTLLLFFISLSSFSQGLLGENVDMGVDVGGGLPEGALSFDEGLVSGLSERKAFDLSGHLRTEFHTLFDDDEADLDKAFLPAFLLELRLKGHWNISDGLFVHGELLYTGLYGALNPLASYDRLGLFPVSASIFSLPTAGDYKHSISVDQAYFSASFDYFSLNIGRQVIGWGTGYFVNPTDKINGKNFLSPEDQLSGTTALVFQFNIYRDTGFRGYLSLEDRSHKAFVLADDVSFSNFPFGLQFRTTLWDWDFSLGYLRDVFYNPSEGSYLRSHYVSFDFSGEFEIGFYGEFSFRLPYGGFRLLSFDEVFEAVVGIDYVFSVGLSFRLEYYRNGDGKSSKDEYDIADVLSGGELFLGQDYLMLYLSKEWLYRYRLSFLSIVNINDTSFVLSPDITMTFFDNLSFSFGTYVVYGPKFSEFDGRFIYNGSVINFSSQTFYFKAKVSF